PSRFGRPDFRPYGGRLCHAGRHFRTEFDQSFGAKAVFAADTVPRPAYGYAERRLPRNRRKDDRTRTVLIPGAELPEHELPGGNDGLRSRPERQSPRPLHYAAG